MHKVRKEDLAALRNSDLFDEQWYLEQYPDVKMLGMDPLEHYLWIGAKLGRKPSRNFDPNKSGELKSPVSNANPVPMDKETIKPKIIEKKYAHASLSSNSYGSSGKQGDLSHVIKRHFDEEWYISQFGTDEVPNDPLAHYEAVGWRMGLSPNRWFDTLGYVSVYKDVARAGVNPFIHFLKSGRRERRSPNPFFVNRHKYHSSLKRTWASEYGPISRVLELNGNSPIEFPLNRSICVHVHAYYTSMMDDIITALRRIKHPFTLLVSVPDYEDPKYWEGYLKNNLGMHNNLIVKSVENRGRDVAPWLVHFREEINNHDYFFHFHTKRSNHASEHKFWFRFLCHTTIGSSHIVDQILNIFESDESVGLLCPGYWPELRRQPNFGAEEEQFKLLCQRMAIVDEYEECPDFPAGSFFWCRVEVLKPLFALNLGINDFPEEEGQVAGTLAHAIERVLGALPRKSSMQTQFVGVDYPHDQAEHQSFDVSDNSENVIHASSLKVSVVMPTWNRRRTVCNAIGSALHQSYAPHEIIVIDDGSTDGTLELLEDRYRDEIKSGRIVIAKSDHQGVSAARNTGLELACGDIITYLDSDNTWRRDYLIKVVSSYESYPNSLSAYTDFLSHDADLDKKSLYNRGYCRSSLVERNYIDLNVFSHRRLFVDQGYRFDTKLKRLVDWDFIIRVTFSCAPLHIQYVGADYNLDESGLNNITRTVPLEDNLERVRAKHRKERVYWGHEPLNFVIKCPAPSEAVAHQWGDYHFAKSLCRSFERLGCKTRIDFLCDWENNDSVNDDVVLLLRGLSKYNPKPGRINLMWLISHPDKVSLDEMREFDHVFVASHSFARSLVPELKTRVTALLQCSDPELFFHPCDDAVKNIDLAFVGNSRRVDRWMPNICVERGLPIQVYGADWEGRIPDSFIRGNHIPNNELGKFYNSTKIVLNDHWPDMAKHGFISNRIFDAGLSGSLVISDNFEGSEIFFDNIICCKDGKEVEDKVLYYLENELDRDSKALNLQNMIRLNHTFDRRAETIMKVLKALMSHNLPYDLKIGVPALVTDSFRRN